MAPVLPVINVGKSSLSAAVRIYSTMDYREKNSEIRLKKKKSEVTRPRGKSLSFPREDNEKLTRKRDYSSELKIRKAKAKVMRKKEDQQRVNLAELRKTGLKEKERLNQLFTIYSAQQGNSYRKAARVVRPKFPNLLKPSTHRPRKIPSSVEGGFLPKISSTAGVDRDAKGSGSRN